MKRYHAQTTEDNSDDMIESEKGDYVKFEDAQKLVDALKFYADKKNWNTCEGSEHYQVEISTRDFDREDMKPYGLRVGGKTARQTLKELGINLENNEKKSVDSKIAGIDFSDSLKTLGKLGTNHD